MQDEVMIDIDNPKDDCISRAYLKDCIHEETHYTGHDILSLLETLPSVPQEPKIDRLYNWLNDMRLGIAPDETVTNIDERNERMIQIDLLDEIIEWLEENGQDNVRACGIMGNIERANTLRHDSLLL